MLTHFHTSAVVTTTLCCTLYFCIDGIRSSCSTARPTSQNTARLSTPGTANCSTLGDMCAVSCAHTAPTICTSIGTCCCSRSADIWAVEEASKHDSGCEFVS